MMIFFLSGASFALGGFDFFARFASATLRSLSRAGFWFAADPRVARLYEFAGQVHRLFKIVGVCRQVLPRRRSRTKDFQ